MRQLTTGQLMFLNQRTGADTSSLVHARRNRYAVSAVALGDRHSEEAAAGPIAMALELFGRNVLDSVLQGYSHGNSRGQEKSVSSRLDAATHSSATIKTPLANKPNSPSSRSISLACNSPHSCPRSRTTASTAPGANLQLA